jgi:hypothetical protein
MGPGLDPGSDSVCSRSLSSFEMTSPLPVISTPSVLLRMDFVKYLCLFQDGVHFQLNYYLSPARVEEKALDII